MSRRSANDPGVPGSRESALCQRAFRHRRKGDQRRALLAFRQAALENDEDPRLWTLYGVQCMRVGQADTARQAIVHAAWLRDRRGERAKAQVTRALLSRLDQETAA